MTDLRLWRASIGRFHLACVARLILNRSRDTGCFNCTDTANVTISISDVFISWLCLVMLVNLLCSLKQLAFSAVFSPYLLSNYEQTNETYISSFSSVTSVAIVSVLRAPSFFLFFYPTLVQLTPILSCVLFALALASCQTQQRC